MPSGRDELNRIVLRHPARLDDHDINTDSVVARTLDGAQYCRVRIERQLRPTGHRTPLGQLADHTGESTDLYSLAHPVVLST